MNTIDRLVHSRLASRRRRALAMALAVALGCVAGPAAAQALTPAFTYQGELRLSSGPAHANYDILPGHAKTAANKILQVDFNPAAMTTIAAVQELGVMLEAERDRSAGQVDMLHRKSAELRARLERLETLMAGDAGKER